jgi:predicted phosphodiesterase
MRYAIISDVHANLEALTQVLRQIDAEGIREIVCLGDIVGYHADPNACVALLRARGVRCVAGNHDRAAVGLRTSLQFNALGRRAIRWTRNELSDDSRGFLSDLPLFRCVDGEFLAVHGALHPVPNDSIRLSRPDRIGHSFSALAAASHGARVCFFGHTHQRALYQHDGREVASIAGSPVLLSERYTYLVNPGSVGKSKCGTHACFAVYETGCRELRFREVAFDRAPTVAKAEAAGLLQAPVRSERVYFFLTDRADSAAYLIRRGLRKMLSAG